MSALGSHDNPYQAHQCGSSPPGDEQVVSGAGVTDDICFVIASNDARTLRLFVKTDPAYPGGAGVNLNPNVGKTTWFALR